MQNSEEAGKVGICFARLPGRRASKKGEKIQKCLKSVKEKGKGSFILRTYEDAKSNPKQKKPAAFRFCHCPGGIKFRRGDLNARGKRRRRALPGYPPPQLFSILARFPCSRGSVSQKFRLTQQSPTHAFSEKGSLFAIRFFHHDTCGKTRVRSFQKHVGGRAH